MTCILHSLLPGIAKGLGNLQGKVFQVSDLLPRCLRCISVLPQVHLVKCSGDSVLWIITTGASRPLLTLERFFKFLSKFPTFKESSMS
jgi:hypothetical protein